ncbi:MAG TPA: glycosyltransferase family 39 protein, partial [Ruminiclostridium sp.]|nr:glycosyltransferase family 39 protein [Ruminiclostridium sp.]
MKTTGNIKASEFLKRHWHVIILALIAILSFGLNFYAISKNGTGNEYYAAAIKSMTKSFKNFFFVSFDPAGMVSVDKPPLALWIQAIFVLIFGYHGWAMLLPQALAGTGSCILLYFLTKKYFGRTAGLISSFVFAITPAVVVVSRNNTMDMQLIFVLLVAVWFLFKSIEKSKWRYLFIAAVFVGLGFNIKMLQAYTILPAFAVIYLVFSKQKFLKRLISGLIAVAIMAVVSFAWVIAVDLTPASNRPYVDSSTNNSVLELIIGHNGLERLYGESMGGGGNFNAGGTPPSMEDGSQNPSGGNAPAMPGGNQNGFPDNSQNSTNPPSAGNVTAQNNQNAQSTKTAQNSQSSNNSDRNGSFRRGSRNGYGFDGERPQFDGGGTMKGAGGNSIGTASVFRLWNSSLYGQASWLLIFALFGIAAFIRKVNLKKLTLKQGVMALWVIWLATMYVFFSFAGFYHQYYLCMLAPQIAVIAGAGFVEMLKHFRNNKGIKRFLLPAALLANLAYEIYYVSGYAQLRSWLLPIMAVSGAAALILMIIHLIKPKRFLAAVISVLTALSLLAAPFYWALTPIMYVPNATMPSAGPELASQNGFDTGLKGTNQKTGTAVQSGLEKYLVAHYKTGSYLVVSQRSSDIAQ